MNVAVREIIEYVQTHPKLTTKDAVDSYFGEILWSLEKDEFERMTPEEREYFVKAIDSAVNKR